MTDFLNKATIAGDVGHMKPIKANGPSTTPWVTPRFNWELDASNSKILSSYTAGLQVIMCRFIWSEHPPSIGHLLFLSCGNNLRSLMPAGAAPSVDPVTYFTYKILHRCVCVTQTEQIQIITCYRLSNNTYKVINSKVVSIARWQDSHFSYNN